MDTEEVSEGSDEEEKPMGPRPMGPRPGMGLLDLEWDLVLVPEWDPDLVLP